jgi:GT2 family glycosyltransferase
VGFFDPDYFMFGEDLDLCFRLKSGGWKVFYLPTARAVHTGTASTGGTSRSLWEFHSAMWTFHHKHYAADLPAFVNGLVWAGLWAHWAVKAGLSAVSSQNGGGGRPTPEQRYSAMPDEGHLPPSGPFTRR